MNTQTGSGDEAWDPALDWLEANLSAEERRRIQAQADAGMLADAERAAAAYMLSSLASFEPLPQDLERSLRLAAAEYIEAGRRRPWWEDLRVAWGGALAGAVFASVITWALVRLPAQEPDTGPVVVALAEAQRIAWAPGPDPTGAGVGGEVVWDPATNQGYMTFTGLSVNDPGREQYQLWIFDAKRDERYPVDGGVFDVLTDGTVRVPIQARLEVGEATLFAVTVEKPGGVVVSDRSRIAALASVKG